jgi:cytochrome c-type biogenesis protein
MARLRAGRAPLGLLVALAFIALAALALTRGPVADVLERIVGTLQNDVARFGSGPALHGPALLGVAFLGGLVASISPCILGMLPVNLAYIGAVGVRSRAQAALVASSFVAGVVAVNAVLGLFSSLFFALFVEYRAAVNISVGVLMAVMGLWMSGILRLRVPSFTRIPTGAGPFAVGVVFALIASPCASPVLVVVLAAAAKGGSPLESVTTMVVYAIGYTAVLFVASLSAGAAAASRGLLRYGETISRVAAAALVLTGIGTVLYGISQN